METSGLIMILVILIFLSAFFSSAETAYTSLNRVRIKLLADEKDSRAKRALLIFDNYDITLVTILFCNNIVNIAAASIGTILVFNLMPELGPDLVAIVSTIGITIFVLIFGEILPKNYAKVYAEKFALSISGILLLLIRILKPFTFIMLKINSLFARLYHTDEDSASVTEVELKAYIDAIENEGILEEEEGELVRSVLDFDETYIGDILTPRTDITGIDISASKDELLEIIFSEKFSRLPLYDDNLDNIVGIIYERDVFVALAKDQKIDLEKMYREAFFVPKSMKASSLLKYLQDRNAHMAIVVDEHGGTCGLITMEDLLEEIVGDIWDEHDNVVERVVVKDGYFIVQYDEPLTDFFDDYIEDVPYPETEYTIIGGWIYELLEVLPNIGDVVNYETPDVKMRMEVIEVENNRVEKIKIVIEKIEKNEKEIKI